MTTWGLIGSGHIGSTVARLALAAGQDVVISNSRGPKTLADLVDELGTGTTAATADEAARAADLVVVTIPLRAYPQVPVEALQGKVVVDTMNYYPERDGRVAALDDGSSTSSELLQAHLPESHVVKGFNNIFFQHLAALPRAAGAENRTALPIAGDDEDAKRVVTARLDELGYDVVDLGPLAEGWRTQPGTPAYGTPYAANPQAWDEGARPAPAAEIAQAAAAARR